MADISKVTLPNGSTYDIKDSTARNQITSEAATRKQADDTIHNILKDLRSNLTGAMHYVGETTANLSDGETVDLQDNSYTIPLRNGNNYKPVAGDVVIYGNKEFVYSTHEHGDGKTTVETGVWNEFGSTGSLKALAFKDSASGSVTPSGTVSKPTFTGTAGTVSVTCEGFINDVSIGSSVATYNSSDGYQLDKSPDGSNSTTDINLTTYVSGGKVTTTPTTASIKQVNTIGTLPTFSATVTNETLSFNFNAGSLPTTTNTSVVTGVSSTLSNPTVEVSPFSVSLQLSQGNETLSGTFTPQGTISQPTFTGNASTVTVK